MKALAALLLLLAGPAVAQDLPFSPEGTEACLAEGSAPDTCIGTSATVCIDSPGGYSTVGMGYCLDQERQYWDARLNAAYQGLRAQMQATDAEMRALGATVPSQADALTAMQRAWIAFRDASCDFERSKWGGGTGGGPATLGCLMEMTARQALFLEAERGQP